jgi:hypothetical protein
MAALLPSIEWRIPHELWFLVCRNLGPRDFIRLKRTSRGLWTLFEREAFSYRLAHHYWSLQEAHRVTVERAFALQLVVHSKINLRQLLGDRVELRAGIPLIPSLLQQLGRLGTCTTLVLRGCRLVFMPPVFKHIPSLRGVDVSNNYLQRFSFAFSQELEFLDLSDNLLTSVTVHRKRMTGSIRALSLANNRYVGDGLCALMHIRGIKSLNVAGCTFLAMDRFNIYSARTAAHRLGERLVFQCLLFLLGLEDVQLNDTTIEWELNQLMDSIHARTRYPRLVKTLMGRLEV